MRKVLFITATILMICIFGFVLVKGFEKGEKRTSKDKVEVETEGLKSENQSVLEVSGPDFNILFLSVAIGEDFLSVKEIMERLHLKGRDSFLKLYLGPAVSQGIVSLLYPKSPRHPRQKYLLTQKGLDFLKETGPEMVSRVERHLAGKGL